MRKSIKPAIYAIIAAVTATAIGTLTSGNSEVLYCFFIFITGLPSSALVWAIAANLDHQTFLSLAYFTNAKGEWAAVLGLCKITGILGIAVNTFTTCLIVQAKSNRKHSKK